MSRLNLGEISRSFDLMGRCEDAFLVFIDKKIFTFWRSVLHVDYLKYFHAWRQTWIVEWVVDILIYNALLSKSILRCVVSL